MAEHDSNSKFWKWEYVLWLDNSPVLFGEKTELTLKMK